MQILPAIERIARRLIGATAVAGLLLLSCSSEKPSDRQDEIGPHDLLVVDGPDASGDLGTDGVPVDVPSETLDCPEGQVAYPAGCGPISTSTCDPGEMLLVRGECASVGPRGCPRLWDQKASVNCESGEQMSCPEGMGPSRDGSYCIPRFDECPTEELPLYGGGCKSIGPNWASIGGEEPNFDHCAESELAMTGGGCASVGPRACDKLWNPASTADCSVGDLEACPEHWAEESDGNGLSWCEPVYSVCNEGERPMLGGGCVRVVPLAQDCPNTTYPAAPAGGEVLYVNAASFCSSGCGTVDHPYPTLAEAVDAAHAGTTILVAEGAYAGFAIGKAIAIKGVCPARVRVGGSVAVLEASDTEPQSASIVIAGTKDVALDALTVANEGVGIVVVDSSEVVLSHLDLQGNIGLGLYLRGARGVSASHLWVHQTRVSPFVALDGTGIRSADSQLMLAESLVEANTNFGITSSGPEGVLTVTQSMVRGTDFFNSTNGVGVLVDSQSIGTLEDVILEKNGYGAVAKHGTYLSLSRSVVRDAATPPTTDELTVGVLAQNGSTVELSQSLIHHVNQKAVAVYHTGSSAVISRCVIRDIQTDKLGALGAGAWAQEGGSMQISASVFLRCHDAAIHMTNLGSLYTPTIAIQGSYMGQTLPSATGWGVGLRLAGGKATSVTHSVFASNRVCGVLARTQASSLSLSSVTIRSTQAEGQSPGVGVCAYASAQVELQSSLVELCNGTGFWVSGLGTHASILASTVRQSQPVGGLFGRGMDAELGAVVQIQQSTILANAEYGILATGSAAVYVLNSSISDTYANASHNTGTGIYATTHASVTVTSSTIARNTTAGIYASESILSVFDSAIADTSLSADGSNGFGLYLASGSTAYLSHTLVVGNKTTGVECSGSVLLLENTLIADTASDGHSQFGIGLEAKDSGFVFMERSLLYRNAQLGMSIRGSEVVAHAWSSVVKSTNPLATGQLGTGIQVTGGAYLDLVDVVLLDNAGCGLLADYKDAETYLCTPTRVTGTRVAVVDTRPAGGTMWGHGIHVRGGASVECAGCLSSGNRQIGMAAFGPSTELLLHGTLVQRTELDGAGVFGVGVGIGAGATAELTFCRLVGNQTFGLLASDSDTHVLLNHSSVEATGQSLDLLPEGTARDASTVAGDGAFIRRGANAQVYSTVIYHNSRSGICFSEATGKLLNSLFIDNSHTGLVLEDCKNGDVIYQGSFGNRFGDNAVGAVGENLGLSFPMICIPPSCTDFSPSSLTDIPGTALLILNSPHSNNIQSIF